MERWPGNFRGTIMASFSATVPLPPSLNHYYRRVGRKTLISQAGRNYRTAIGIQARHEHWPFLVGPVSITCIIHWPDRRRRDVDNYRKALYDALTKVGAWQDDSCVQHDSMTVAPNLCKPGKIEITVRELRENAGTLPTPERGS